MMANTQIHFVEIRVGWNICEECSITVQRIPFVRIGFGWEFRRRSVAWLNTFLQRRYIILAKSHKIQIELVGLRLVFGDIREITCEMMSPRAVRTWYKYLYFLCLASSRVSRGREFDRVVRCACRRERGRLRWFTRHAVMKHCTRMLKIIATGQIQMSNPPQHGGGSGFGFICSICGIVEKIWRNDQNHSEHMTIVIV